jgi:hypothetical protein
MKMKRLIFAGALFLAAAAVFAQQAGGRQQFDLFGGDGYNGTGSQLVFALDGPALKVSGTASGAANGGGGYVIETKEPLEFNNKSRLIVKVTGIRGTDTFDAVKLLKLELNDRAQTTVTPGMLNRNDAYYINARDGEAVFNISALRNIRKINLVFFNCTITDMKIEVFYE